MYSCIPVQSLRLQAEWQVQRVPDVLAWLLLTRRGPAAGIGVFWGRRGLFRCGAAGVTGGGVEASGEQRCTGSNGPVLDGPHGEGVADRSSSKAQHGGGDVDDSNDSNEIKMINRISESEGLRSGCAVSRAPNKS